MRSMARRQIVFTTGMLIVGCIEAAIAFSLAGLRGVEGVGYSVLLCLVPGWLTIFASELLRHKDLAVYAVLLGTGLRVVFVLLGMFVINALRSDLGFREFTVWLISGYLVALALETWMVLTPATEKAAS